MVLPRRGMEARQVLDVEQLAPNRFGTCPSYAVVQPGADLAGPLRPRQRLHQGQGEVKRGSGAFAQSCPVVPKGEIAAALIPHLMVDREGYAQSEGLEPRRQQAQPSRTKVYPPKPRAHSAPASLYPWGGGRLPSAPLTHRYGCRRHSSSSNCYCRPSCSRRRSSSTAGGSG